MFFLRSSAVLLLAAALAAANPIYSENYGDDGGFGYSASSGLNGAYLGDNFGYGSNSNNAQRTVGVSRAFNQGLNNGYVNNDAVRGYGNGYAAANNGASDSSRLSDVSGNGFNGFSGRGFNGFGTFSSVPGVVFAFPSLTSVSYRRVPQQNNDLATLALLSALLSDSNVNSQDNNAASQTVARQSYANRGPNVAYVPYVTVASPAAQQQKTTKIVKTTIETDGAMPNIAGLKGALASIASASASDSFDALTDSSAASNGRSYPRSGSSARVY